MIFQPGAYYVGDPGFVLPNDDLRILFKKIHLGLLESGPIGMVTSRRPDNNNNLIMDNYWIAVTPGLAGTVYDDKGLGWGFEWGGFGVVPWQWAEKPQAQSSLTHKVEFAEPFECSCTEDSITIGHLHFTFNPK